MKVLLLALLLLTSACERTTQTRNHAPAILDTLGFTVKTDVYRDELSGWVTYLVTPKRDTSCLLYSMDVYAYSDLIKISDIKCVDRVK